ncbi:hypothetical protein Trydic_g2260 [Trypoxylus dichotomus]
MCMEMQQKMSALSNNGLIALTKLKEAEELCSIGSLSKDSVMMIIRQLEYSKVVQSGASVWREMSFWENPVAKHGFLIFNLKWQSMESHHTNPPRTRKFKTVRSVEKRMATVLWDAKGVIMVDFLEQACTIKA